MMQRCFLVSASDAAELPRCASCQLASARRCSARAGSPRLSPSSALATEGTSAKQLKTPQLVFCCPTPLKNHFTSIITLRNWKTTRRRCSLISPPHHLASKSTRLPRCSTLIWLHCSRTYLPDQLHGRTFKARASASPSQRITFSLGGQRCQDLQQQHSPRANRTHSLLPLYDFPASTRSYSPCTRSAHATSSPGLAPHGLLVAFHVSYAKSSRNYYYHLE